MARAKNKGLTLPCPSCGSLEATFRLDLNTLMLTCEECEDSMDAVVARNQIAAHLRRWDAVVELVDHASATFASALHDELKAGFTAIAGAEPDVA